MKKPFRLDPRRRAPRRLLAPLLIILLQAGCESAEPPPTSTGSPEVSGPPTTQSPTPEPTVLRQGKYIFHAPTGGTGTLEIPGAPVAEIEELRNLVKAAPVTYLTAAVDNRHGSVPINMQSVSIFTPAGVEYKYEGAFEYIDRLRRALPTDAPAETHNRYIELSIAYLDGAPPLAVKDFVLVGPEVPQEISGIIVNPTGGFHPVPAVPAG